MNSTIITFSDLTPQTKNQGSERIEEVIEFLTVTLPASYTPGMIRRMKRCNIIEKIESVKQHRNQITFTIKSNMNLKAILRNKFNIQIEKVTEHNS